VVSSAEDAETLLNKLLPYHVFVPCVKADNSKVLQLDPSLANASFNKEHYYLWVYQGSQLKALLGGILIVLVIFAGVMFPLWPYSMRVGVSYLSNVVMGLIALLIVVSIIRLIVWFVTRVSMGTGLWIYPNLYADVGFFDSFRPFMAWEDEKPAKTGKGKGKVQVEEKKTQ
jgi:translocation protein SEC62